MPWAHRWIGNPVLTFILNVFYGVRVSDAHCGMRAIRRSSVPKLDLQATGMEFASEMILKASKRKLRVGEIPIDYQPRIGESKLNTWRDGWRHLRFMLLHSSTFLFLIPGGALLCSGPRDHAAARDRARSTAFGLTWYIHAMIAGSPRDARRRPDRPARPLRPHLRAALPQRARPAARARLEHACGSSTACCWAPRLLLLGGGMLVGDLRRVGVGRVPGARARPRGALRHDACRRSACRRSSARSSSACSGCASICSWAPIARRRGPKIARWRLRASAGATRRPRATCPQLWRAQTRVRPLRLPAGHAARRSRDR